MKKRIVFITMLLLTVLVICVSCSQPSLLSGTYVEDDTYLPEVFVFDGKGGFKWGYGSRSGGTVTLPSSYTSGTYNVTDNTVTLKLMGISTRTGKIEGSKLKIDGDYYSKY